MKTVRKLLFYILQVSVFGLLVWYLYQNRQVFHSLANIQWQHILWIALLEIASFTTGICINYMMIHRLNEKVTFLDSFLLQYANNFLNRILPTIGGGATFRAIFLKKKYQFPYAQFASTVAGLYVISFSSTALIAISCLLIIYHRLQVFNWILFLAFSGILAATLSIIFITPNIPHSDNKALRILHNIIEGWKSIKKDWRFVLLYTGLSIAIILFSALQTYFSYIALGVKTTFLPMLFLSTLGIIIAFLNFTPDGIGVKEGLYIFSTELVVIPNNILVLGSMILRGISLFTTFTVGGICYLVLFRQMQRMENNNQIT
jgi:uncharacterized protein (TIRG00374 family)